MSSRIEKGGHRFQPKLAAGARRRPGQSSALPAAARPPPPPSPAAPSQDKPPSRPVAAAGSSAMSPPPPPPRSIRTPSASPHPSGSATGAIRSYASATPSSSRIQVAGQSPVNFKPPTPKAASIVPGSGPGYSGAKPSGAGVARITPSPRPPAASAANRQIDRSSTAAREEQTSVATPSKRPITVSAPSAQPEPIASDSGGRNDASSSAANSSVGPASEPMEAGPSQQEANAPAAMAARQMSSRPKASPFAPTGSSYRPSNIQFAAPPGHPSTRESVDPPAASVSRHGKGRAHQGPSVSDEMGSSSYLARQREASETGNAPSSAFDLFCQDREATLLEANPNVTRAELTKLLEEAWIGVSNQEKSYWEERYQEVMTSNGAGQHGVTTDGPDRFGQAAEEAAPHSGSDTSISDSGPTAKKRKRSGTKTNKRKKQTGEPKRPASAYLLYSQNVRKSESSQGDSSERSKEGFGEMSKRIGDQWRNLPLEEKQPYLRQAEELKKQYLKEVETWRAQHPELAGEAPEDTDGEESLPRPRRKSRAKVPKQTVSDDEREYQALIAEHGRDLEDLRLDPKATSMADLAIAELKSGRASQRLFDLNRVRLKQLEDAAVLRKAEKQKLKQRIQQTEENLRKQKAGERVDLPKHDPRKDDLRRGGRSLTDSSQQHADSQANPSSSETGPAQHSRTAEQEDEEEVEALSGMDLPPARYIVPGLDDDDDDDDNEETNGHARGGTASRPGRSANKNGSDDDDDAASDNGSVRSATSGGTYASLRETAHVPQMRVVDGQIVLDETSLTVNRNQEQAFEESDMIDEEIGHKFVNSSTGSKREKSVRWTAVETDKFFKAVSMWGSDFEMISRMFPNRSRKQVKNKWTREERANPTRLDVAFARRLPVDLDRYAIMANVDLSGPAPRVDDSAMGEEEGKLIKKGEASDDEGRDEGDEAEREMRNIDKVSATPDPSRARRGSSAGEAGAARSLRASSVASARSTAGAGGETSSSRQQQQQKSRQQLEREKRESREKARRADSLREGREKRSVSRGVSRGAQDDAEDYGGPEEEEVVALPAEGFY